LIDVRGKSSGWILCTNNLPIVSELAHLKLVHVSEQRTAQVVQSVTVVDSVVQVTEQEKLQQEIGTLQLALQKLIEQKHNNVTSTQQSVSALHHTNTNMQLNYYTQKSTNTTRQAMST